MPSQTLGLLLCRRKVGVYVKYTAAFIFSRGINKRLPGTSRGECRSPRVNGWCPVLRLLLCSPLPLKTLLQ